jgi:hypothetical protein
MALVDWEEGVVRLTEKSGSFWNVSTEALGLRIKSDLHLPQLQAP